MTTGKVAGGVVEIEPEKAWEMWRQWEAVPVMRLRKRTLGGGGDENRGDQEHSEVERNRRAAKTLWLTQAKCFHSPFMNTDVCVNAWLFLVELLWQTLLRSHRNLANTFSLRSPSSCCLFFCLAALLAEGTTALWMCEASLRTASVLQLLSCCFGTGTEHWRHVAVSLPPVVNRIGIVHYFQRVDEGSWGALVSAKHLILNSCGFWHLIAMHTLQQLPFIYWKPWHPS